MSQSGSGTGSSLGKDRPILGAFQDRKSESESWRTGFSNYVSRMRELCPEESHPDEEWLNKGFALILLDQGQEVTTQDQQGAVGSGGQVSGGTAQASPGSLPTMPAHLDAAASGVAGLRIVLNTRPLLKGLKTVISAYSLLLIGLYKSTLGICLTFKCQLRNWPRLSRGWHPIWRSEFVRLLPPIFQGLQGRQPRW